MASIKELVRPGGNSIKSLVGGTSIKDLVRDKAVSPATDLFDFANLPVDERGVVTPGVRGKAAGGAMPDMDRIVLDTDRPGMPEWLWTPKDFATVGQAVKILASGESPYEKDRGIGKELYDRLAYYRTSLLSLGGRLGPKGLREDLAKEAESFGGFGPAVMPAAGQTGQLALEWGWLYPKLFKLAGYPLEGIKRIPQVARAAKVLKSLGGVQRLAEQHPHVYSAGAKAIEAFAKGEMVGQTTAAIESFGKDKSAEEWLVDMNKRGAVLGGVATAFSLAHSGDQYRYISKVSKLLKRNAYGRHQTRLAKGFTERASGKMLKDEGQKIEDTIWYLEQEMLGAPVVLYGGKKPELSPQKMAESLAKQGYYKGKPGRTARQLTQIKKPSAPRDELSKKSRVPAPERLFALKPKPGTQGLGDNVVVVRSAEGHELGLYPEGTTFSKLPKGVKVTTEAISTHWPGKGTVRPAPLGGEKRGPRPIDDYRRRVRERMQEVKDQIAAEEARQAEHMRAIGEERRIQPAKATPEIEPKIAAVEKKPDLRAEKAELKAEGKAEPSKLSNENFPEIYRKYRKITVAAEKNKMRAMTPEERALWDDSKNWQAFSRKQGYTEKEIEDYRYWIELNKDPRAEAARGFEDLAQTMPEHSLTPEGRVIIKSDVGEIHIPEPVLSGEYGEDLKTIFYFGNFQSDIPQTKLERSLSVGDTIEYKGHTLMVMPQGWRDVTGLSDDAIEAIQESPNATLGTTWRAADKKLREQKKAAQPAKAEVTEAQPDKLGTLAEVIDKGAMPTVLAAQKKAKAADRNYFARQTSKGKWAMTAAEPKTGIFYALSPDGLVARFERGGLDTAKFAEQARIEEAATKGEMGEIEIEPVIQTTSNAFNEHIEYFQSIQLPETSEIRMIQKRMRQVNGQRLAGTITATEANKRIAALRKLLLSTAQKEGISVRATKGGKISLAVRKAGTYVPVEFSEYGKFKDTYPLGQDCTRSIQQIDGALTVKEKAKTKGQAGALERYVLWRTRDMSIQKLKWIKEKSAMLKKIVKVRRKSQDDTRINDILERIASEGRDVPINKVLSDKRLRSMAKPAIIKQAVELREFYDELLDEQNITRKLRGQDPIPYRRNYSPQILRDATIWERVMMRGKKPKDIFGEKTPLPDYIKPNKPFNPRELAREAGIPYEDRIKSAIELAQNYLVTAAKDIFNTSIIQNNKAFAQQLQTMGLDRPHNYIQDWTSEAYAGVKPALDRAIKLTYLPRAQRGMRWFNRLRNLAVFPFNLSWNLLTQPSSLALTVGRYGAANTMRGFVQWLTPSIRAAAAGDYYSYIVKSAKQGRITQQDAQNLIGESVQLHRTKGDLARDFSTFLLEQIERFLTGTSIRAAHLHGLKRGLTGEALKQYASDGGAKTQSMYNDEDKPAFLRNLSVKTAAPYQTFAYEVMNTLREWVGTTGTPPDTKLYTAWTVLRFLAAAAVFSSIAKKAANKDVWSWKRPPVPFAEFWLSPIIRIFNKEYIGGSASGLTSPVETAQRIAKGINDVLEADNWRKLRNELIKYGPGVFGVPGGVQFARTIDAIIAYSEGGVRDRRGRMLFEMDEPKDLIQGIFGGVWSTEGGREKLEGKAGRKKDPWTGE